MQVYFVELNGKWGKSDVYQGSVSCYLVYYYNIFCLNQDLEKIVILSLSFRHEYIVTWAWSYESSNGGLAKSPLKYSGDPL